jgi:hypothetical protein
MIQRLEHIAGLCGDLAPVLARLGRMHQRLDQGHEAAFGFAVERHRAALAKVIDQAEPSPVCSSPSCTLDLSKSRACDATLEILRAYKLTGDFHVNLEIVLKSLGVFDKVTFKVEPTAALPYHPDCRHVVFRPNADLPIIAFNGIIRAGDRHAGRCVPSPNVQRAREGRVR